MYRYLYLCAVLPRLPLSHWYVFLAELLISKYPPTLHPKERNCGKVHVDIAKSPVRLFTAYSTTGLRESSHRFKHPKPKKYSANNFEVVKCFYKYITMIYLTVLNL